MSSNAIRDIDRLHPIVQLNLELFLKECETRGYKVGISETYRTIERQDYLYAQGRTREGTIVTNAKGQDMSSYHQWGLAVDIFQNIRGAEYELDFLENIGVLAETWGFEWGGRWTSFKDMPHLQMTFGLSIQQLKLGLAVEDVIDHDHYDNIRKLVTTGNIKQLGLWLTLKNVKETHIKSLIKRMADNLQ